MQAKNRLDPPNPVQPVHVCIMRNISLIPACILEVVNSIYKIFEKSRIFPANLRTNQNFAVVGRSGGGVPRTPEKISIFKLKTNEKLQF